MDEQLYDAVVIGSGAGGGTAAWGLVEQGFRVLILEAGPRFDPGKDYLADKASWESPFPHKPMSQGRYSYAPMQGLADENTDIRSWNKLSGLLNKTDHRAGYGYHHVRAVGGSSLHFSGEAHRLNPLAMRMKSQFGVAADWPVSYDELEPYYLMAERFVGVSGPVRDLYRPRSAAYPMKPHQLSYASQILRKGFTKQGLNLVENSLAILSESRSDRPGCNYCGCCLKGCPLGDKGSVDVTYLRAAEKTGLLEVRTGTSVTKIVTGDQDRIKGVEYVDAEGEGFVAAEILIVAGGAIETPRLLLASSDSSSPDGLANESGEVGKNFMETLLWSSNALFPENISSYKGLSVDSICWDYNAPDAIDGVIGGCRFSPSVAESDLLGPVNYAQRVVKGWGRAHKQGVRSMFGKMLSLSGISESLPHPGSYIDLDPVAVDDNNVPIARIHSYVDEMAVKRIRFMASVCRNVLKASGAEAPIEEFSSYDIFSSTHVFGTCRMGDSPESSVVDRWGKSHRWENLYILDSSIFPSSGGGESPGLTIQALALRAVDKIGKRK